MLFLNIGSCAGRYHIAINQSFILDMMSSGSILCPFIDMCHGCFRSKDSATEILSIKFSWQIFSHYCVNFLCNKEPPVEQVPVRHLKEGMVIHILNYLTNSDTKLLSLSKSSLLIIKKIMVFFFRNETFIMFLSLVTLSFQSCVKKFPANGIAFKLYYTGSL